MQLSEQQGVLAQVSPIAKRDSDRAAYAAKMAQRHAQRDARSHKRGFGVQRRSERFA